VAGAGFSARTDGQFARFPLAAPRMSAVAAGRAMVVREDLASGGLADPTWFAAHRIASYGVWPLTPARIEAPAEWARARERSCLGALVLFSRRMLSDEDAAVL